MTELPILMYHHLTRTDDELRLLPAHERPYAVDAEAFRAQLAALAQAGFEAVLPGVPFASTPHGRPVVISFDDTCSSHARIAAPELERLGWKGLFLVVTGEISGSGPLSAEDLRALVRAGHGVGSHTRTHRFLNRLDGDELDQELAGSALDLTYALGRTPLELSLPGGRWDERTLAAARAAGYARVLDSEPRINRDPGESGVGAFRLGRVCVRRGWTSARVVAAAQGHGMAALRLETDVKLALRRVMGETVYDRFQRGLSTWRGVA